MEATRFKLPGASELTPIRQSDLAGLCGLYSSLNAVQLAVFPWRLSRMQLQDLYRAGVALLSRRRQLSQVLGAGMDEDVWLQLVEAVVGHANSVLGSTLVVRPVLSKTTAAVPARAIGRIRAAVLRGSPVLAGLGGALDHFTVVAGFTEQRLLLFDGSGLKWLAVNGIGVGPECGSRHCLFTGSVNAIVDDW